MIGLYFILVTFLLPIAGITALLFLQIRFVRRQVSASQCPACDYNRESTPEYDPCPECGLLLREAAARLQPPPPARRYWVLALPIAMTIPLAALSFLMPAGFLMLPIIALIATALLYIAVHGHLTSLEQKWVLVPYGVSFGVVALALSALALATGSMHIGTFFGIAYTAWCIASGVLVLFTPIVLILAQRRASASPLPG